MSIINNKELELKALNNGLDYNEKPNSTTADNPIKYKSMYRSSEYLLRVIKNWAIIARVVFFGIIWIYFSISLLYYIAVHLDCAQKIIAVILEAEKDKNILNIICGLFNKLDITKPPIFITSCVSLVVVYFIKKKYHKDKNIDDIDFHSEN